MLNSSQGDQTLDPSRLELLPLTRGQQVRGLLIAGLVSPAALGTLIGALGPALGSAMSTGARLGAIALPCSSCWGVSPGPEPWPRSSLGRSTPGGEGT